MQEDEREEYGNRSNPKGRAFLHLMLRMRALALGLSFASTLSAACTAAYADQPAPRRIAAVSPRTALALAPERIRAPFDVSLIDEHGNALSTFAHNGRYYVLGDAGDRYTIRVTNPTARRIEAVVSVDGLDVIDGENGDLAKRGYIVQPYGDLRIEGFRTSQSDVATFRFSSVGGSYAGKKGKARNVGVIAVALFEEQAPPEMVEQEVVIGHHHPGHRNEELRRNKGWGRGDSNDDGAVAKAAKRPTGAMDRRLEPAAEAPATAGAPARTMPAPYPRPMPPPPPHDYGGEQDEGAAECCAPRPQEQRERLGLGTEFGEQRYSAASYTRFVRAAGKPIAIAELRYNDGSGLAAMGILAAPQPDEDEIMMRETADPFPGDRFARPPR
jgi:hypothetical protein